MVSCLNKNRLNLTALSCRSWAAIKWCAVLANNQYACIYIYIYIHIYCWGEGCYTRNEVCFWLSFRLYLLVGYKDRLVGRNYVFMHCMHYCFYRAFWYFFYDILDDEEIGCLGILKCHGMLANFIEMCVPKVQINNKHCVRKWLGATQATSHYLNQCWPSSQTHICGIGEDELTLITFYSVLCLSLWYTKSCICKLSNSND